MSSIKTSKSILPGGNQSNPTKKVGVSVVLDNIGNLPKQDSKTGQHSTKATNANSGNLPAKKSQEPVTLNFINAEIDAVAKTLATLSGHNVVVDPRVKGTITLTSNVPVAPSQALRLFAAQLRTQSFALVESAGLYLVVPEADAKLQSGGVSAGAVPASNGQILTQIFQLNHENANNLVPILRPLISPNNTLNVNPGTNALVITDYADNLQRLARIVAALDVANATGVIPPRPNARAYVGASVGSDGRAYLAGGSLNGDLTSVTAFNFASSTYATVAPMNVPHSYYPLVSLADGRLLAIGGRSTSGTSITRVEAYTVSNNTWR